MNAVADKLQVRAARKNAKRNEKRQMIADSALEALQELGYANTSLRDIAAKCDLSLGMLHYYFEDRSDLIIYCVQQYKTEFAEVILGALRGVSGRDAVIKKFSLALAAAAHDESVSHTLWYDIRSQAMFDEAFRPVVLEIEEMLIDLVRSAMDAAGHEDTSQADIYYGLVDGLFRFILEGRINGTGKSREESAAIFEDLLDRVL